MDSKLSNLPPSGTSPVLSRPELQSQHVQVLAMQGGSRLVAAMEHVDRVVATFLDDVGRAVAQVRAEVAIERDEALAHVSQARLELDQRRAQLERERTEFDATREESYRDLERHRDAFRQEKERDKKERQAAENEIRELGRQSQQAQQVALAQLQAAHTVPALHKFTSTTPSTMTPGFLPNVQGEWRPHEGIPDKEMSLTQTLDAGALSEQLPNAGGGCSLLFAVGGLQRANSPLWTAEVFETDKGGWRLLPEMKSARGYLSVARGLEQTLLAIGGSDGQQTINTVEEYNHMTGTWRQVASMQRPRIWLAAATLNDITYAAGGFDGVEYLSLVEAFHPLTHNTQGKWVACQSLASSRSTLGLAACQGTLYAVGGFSSPNYLSTVEAYDPNANQWWGLAPMRAPRRDLGLAALDQRGMIVAAGGYDGNSYLSRVEGFDARANQWRELAPLHHPRQLLGLCAMGDVVYAVGGFDGQETTRVVEMYDVRMDSWQQLPPLSTQRLGLGVVAM